MTFASADVRKQIQNRVKGHVAHAASGRKGVALDQAIDDLDLFFEG
jgi:hypothetical protein